MGHNCREPIPENCRNNPRIGLTKNDMHYSLSLCSGGKCLPSNHHEWIECSDVCEMCRSILGPNGRIFTRMHNKPALNITLMVYACMHCLLFCIECTGNTECEQRVDSFLNSYCTSALPSTTTITQPGQATTVTVTRTQVQPAVTVTRVETMTRTSTVTISPAASGSPPSSSSSSSSQSGQSTISSVDSMVPSSQASSSSVPTAEFALAALFGLAIIVLMAVIAGWVLTYLILKKRANENNGVVHSG